MKERFSDKQLFDMWFILFMTAFRMCLEKKYPISFAREFADYGYIETLDKLDTWDAKS